MIASPSSWRKLLITVGTTVLIVAAIGWLPGLSTVRGWIWWGLTPIARPLQRLSRSISGSFQFLFHLGQIKRENESLRAQVESNTSTAVELEELRKENSQLREQLGFQERTKLPSVEAHIIGRDAIGTSQQITIDRGSSDGIALDHGVTSAAGIFIGTVTQVESHSAVIRLVTDNRSVIPVRVEETGAEGVARGVHGLEIELVYVPVNTPLSVGAMIITSGLGGTLPAGIAVGRVTDIHTSASDLFHEATIQSSAFLDELQSVYVLQATP